MALLTAAVHFTSADLRGESVRNPKFWVGKATDSNPLSPEQNMS